MTRDEFKTGVKVFTDCVKDFKLETGKMETWYKLLKHLGSEPYLRAVYDLCQTEKNIYPGTNVVAMILEKVKEVTSDGTPLDTKAILALDKFEKGYRKPGVGSSVSVVFDDPVIHAVIDSLGGWASLENTLKEDWKWKRKEFKETYIALHPEVLAGRAKFPEILKGRDRLRNQRQGLKPPVIIGDKDKAIDWVNERRAIEGRAPVQVKALESGEENIKPSSLSPTSEGP